MEVAAPLVASITVQFFASLRQSAPSLSSCSYTELTKHPWLI